MFNLSGKMTITIKKNYRFSQYLIMLLSVNKNSIYLVNFFGCKNSIELTQSIFLKFLELIAESYFGFVKFNTKEQNKV